MLRNFIKHFKRQPSSAASRDVDLANCSTSTAIDTGSSRVRAKLFENVKITQREKRDKLLSSRRGDLGSANSEEANTSSLSQTNATYLVDNNQMAAKKPAMTKHEEMKRDQMNNRRKMLEEWRAKKKKENEMKQAAPAVAPKPTFKVHHVDNRLFEKPKSTLPTSSSFNFHMKLDASNQSASCKRAVTVSNLHSSTTTTATSTAAAIGQVKKPVTRSQSKIETKKPVVEHKPTAVPTSREKPHAPVRSTSSASVSSAASAVAARRAPPASTTTAQSHPTTRRNVSASSVGTKKQTTAPKAPVSNQFVAPMPPPPPPPQSNANTTISMHQPLATSSTSDLLAAEVDRISNKMGSSVTISSKRLSKDRLSNTIVQQQPPQTPTITISEEKETPKTMTLTVQSPPKAAPVQQLDSAYFDSIELDKRDVAYYKALVDFKTSLLNGFRSQWTERLDAEGALVPDDVQGDVRAACGLAHLLIKERFDQFSDLIQQCENAQTIAQSGDVSEMPALVVRCSDLQGFWDMVEKQVENVTVRFEYLEKVKSNNYVKTPELDEFLFNKLSSDNKPKETTGEVKKPTKFIRPTYLKKTTAAAKTDENKPDESTETAAKPKPKPAVSRFAEFRKAKLQQANAVAAPSTDTAEVEVEIMLPPMPKTPGSSEFAAAALTESAEILNSAQTKSGKSRRSSRKSNVVVEPKRYNLRSRPSDLIKFDSPVSGGSRASILPTMHLHTLDEDSSMICSPSSTSTKQTSDPFSTPGAHITKSMKKSLIRNVAADLLEEEAEEENAIQEEDENKENTVIDYLGECGAVLGSAPINVMTLKMRASIAPSAMGQSAYTPQKRVSMAVRESLEPDRIVNLSRSPLLKLALISSHSKRLSLSRPNDFPPL